MKHKKTAVLLVLLIALAALTWKLSTWLTPQQLQQALQQTGGWAPVLYIGLFVLLPAFFLPVAVLALAGGLLFGLWWGSVYTFIGAVLNCALMFLLARYVGRSQVQRLVEQKLSPQWQRRLQMADGKEGFLLLIILRLIPAVPYNLINYTFGLTGISFSSYLLASAIGIIPGTFAFINIGDKTLEAGSPSFWIAIGLLVLLLAVTGLLGKKLFPGQKKCDLIKKEWRAKMKTANKPKRNYARWIILIVAVLLCALYFFVPPVQEFVGHAASVLASADVDSVVEYIRSFGAYAMIFSFCLMVFQSVMAPLPAFLITFANAAIFGWWQGAILSWTSSMAGAVLCFYIARGLGRDVVERFAGTGALASVEGYFEKYGSKTILVCRLLPFVSFDAVSYFAGLTPIKLLPFLIATGLGQLPATIIYSYVGGMLTGGVKYFVTGLLCIFSLGILVSIIKRVYNDRQAKAGAQKDGSHE